MLVIAMHGAAANAATWIPVQRYLPPELTCLAGDLPGHGTRRDEPFDFTTAVDEVVAIARRAGPGTILAGDSLGGYIALSAAARLGDGVAGVVAGSCAFAMRGIAGIVARLSLVPGVLVPPGAVRALLFRMCGPDVARAIDARGLAPAMRNATLRALIGHDVLADVRAIRAPVTFVVGAFDIPIAWNVHRFARAAARGTAIVIPNATHGVGLTQPQRFADAIGEFASDASRRR